MRCRRKDGKQKMVRTSNLQWQSERYTNGEYIYSAEAHFVVKHIMAAQTEWPKFIRVACFHYSKHSWCLHKQKYLTYGYMNNTWRSEEH